MDPVGENPSKHWKFKNDLLKTKADIVSQKSRNFTNVCMVGADLARIIELSKSHKSIWGVRSVVFRAED